MKIKKKQPSSNVSPSPLCTEANGFVNYETAQAKWSRMKWNFHILTQGLLYYLEAPVILHEKPCSPKKIELGTAELLFAISLSAVTAAYKLSSLPFWTSERSHSDVYNRKLQCGLSVACSMSRISLVGSGSSQSIKIKLWDTCGKRHQFGLWKCTLDPPSQQILHPLIQPTSENIWEKKMSELNMHRTFSWHYSLNNTM